MAKTGGGGKGYWRLAGPASARASPSRAEFLIFVTKRRGTMASARQLGHNSATALGMKAHSPGVMNASGSAMAGDGYAMMGQGD